MILLVHPRDVGQPTRDPVGSLHVSAGPVFVALSGMSPDRTVTIHVPPRPSLPRPSLEVLPRPPRSLAPDLARGMLLLFIASANVWGYLWSPDALYGPSGRPLDGSTLDHVVDGIVTFVVDSRSRPMFAILYGFGLATMAARLTARGGDRRTTRRVLARRSTVLIALGLAHAALLYAGDILAPYGATGLVALAFLHRSRTTLAWWFSIGYGLTLLAGSIAVFGAFDDGTAGAVDLVTPTYLTSMLDRLVIAATATSLFTLTLMFVPHVVVGILLARSGWLTRPADHRRRLGQVAVGAAVVNVVGALPYALAVAHVWHPDGTLLGLAELAHHVSGDVMGLGYVCVFGWLAAIWGDRARGGAVSVVTAVGERSLTCYLLQSVLFAPLLSAWGLGLGGRIGTAQAAALAVGVWLVTVAVAVALQRAGRRGPFEALLRRIAYGRQRTGPSSSTA